MIFEGADPDIADSFGADSRLRQVAAHRFPDVQVILPLISRCEKPLRLVPAEVLPERLQQFLSDLIAAHADARTDRRRDVPRIGAEPFAHHAQRVHRDAAARAPPAVMHHRRGMPYRIIQVQRQAVRGPQMDQHTRNVRDDAVVTARPFDGEALIRICEAPLGLLSGDQPDVSGMRLSRGNHPAQRRPQKIFQYRGPGLIVPPVFMPPVILQLGKYRPDRKLSVEKVNGSHMLPFYIQSCTRFATRIL